MPETFLILLAGGVPLAAGVPDPRTVPVKWQRKAGATACVATGLALFFALVIREVPAAGSAVVQRVQTGLLATTVVAVVAFAVVAWTGRPRAIRACAIVAYVLAVLAGSHLLHEEMAVHGTSRYPGRKTVAMALQAICCAGVAALAGLVVMNATLTGATSKAPAVVAPLRRLNFITGVFTGLRLLVSVAAVVLFHRAVPVEHLWPTYGALIGARWALGLLVPAIVLHLGHARLVTPETPAPVALLAVAAALALAGEFVALHLVRQTGLPF